jgi:signal transduction histidine kinase
VIWDVELCPRSSLRLNPPLRKPSRHGRHWQFAAIAVGCVTSQPRKLGCTISLNASCRCVADTGVGIATEDQQRISKSFVQIRQTE